MDINVDDIDPRSFCMDDLFIRVMKVYQQEELDKDDDDFDWRRR